MKNILMTFLIASGMTYSLDITSDFNNEDIITEEINISGTESNLMNTGILNGVRNSIVGGVNSINNSGVILGTPTVLPNTDLIGNAVLAEEIKSFTNSGNIMGELTATSADDLLYLGNGVFVGDIGELTNTGIISGNSSNGQDSGNGIIGVSVGNITNNGRILGNGLKGNSATGGIGNGIALSFVGDILNNGVISGYSDLKNQISGNGIEVWSSFGDLTNNGIILGSSTAIKGTPDSITNNGILAGVSLTPNEIYTKNGLKVTLNTDGDIVSVDNGSGGTVGDKTIVNGSIEGTDSSIRLSLLPSNNNLIINGAGVNEGALISDGGEYEIDSSIINGYATALYLKDNSNLKLTDVSINGGGLKGDIDIVRADSSNNKLAILGNSIVNGNISLGSGSNDLTIGNSVQLNGNLSGGVGSNNTLNLGQKASTRQVSNLNVFNNVSNFKNLNTNGNVTLYETAKVTGVENIVLESGNLLLRVNPNIVNSDGKVSGHALYDNNGTLSSTGGTLVVGLNGLGAGTTVSLGNTTILDGTDDSWWKETDYIKTNSLTLDGKVASNGKDIEITVLDTIPLEPSKPIIQLTPLVPSIPTDNENTDGDINEDTNEDTNTDNGNQDNNDDNTNTNNHLQVDSNLYQKLNKVYRSIVTAGEIGELANTTLLEDKTFDESLENLLIILDETYSNNPYAYTLKSTRDSLKLFEDNLTYLTIKPKMGELIVQGRGLYNGVKSDYNSRTSTNTYGGLATFEYGTTDKTSIGFAIGGNNQDINFRGANKIDGDSLYLGIFTKTEVDNLKIFSGLGYQYTSIDANRNVGNRYNYFSTSDKYDVNSLNAFVEAKYVYNVDSTWTIEPKIKLSYYNIRQDKVNEGYTPGKLSLKTDKVKSSTADLEIGADFVRSTYMTGGELKNIFSIGIINTIGQRQKDLKGYILGKDTDGTRFDIKGMELPKTSGIIGYNLELEQDNGMLYSIGANYEFAKDYNRNLNVTVGLGYKF